MSLLGAIAYLAHTRLDIVVFVCALQRFAHAPKVEHARKLNKLVSWTKKHPNKLMYKDLQLSPGGSTRGGSSSAEASVATHLRVVSDAAFKRETEKGHCLRGLLLLRASGTSDHSFTSKDAVVHALGWGVVVVVVIVVVVVVVVIVVVAVVILPYSGETHICHFGAKMFYSIFR